MTKRHQEAHFTIISGTRLIYTRHMHHHPERHALISLLQITEQKDLLCLVSSYATRLADGTQPATPATPKAAPRIAARPQNPSGAHSKLKPHLQKLHRAQQYGDGAHSRHQLLLAGQVPGRTEICQLVFCNLHLRIQAPKIPR